METTTKTIVFTVQGTGHKGHKEKVKRKVTGEKRWTHSETVLSGAATNVLSTIRDTLTHAISCNKVETMPDKTAKLVYSQICSKITGYRAQDVDKGLYDATQFITVKKTIDILLACDLQCHFCNDTMRVLYEYVREPMQWSLDRIDNKAGHNADNVYAACLRCNLKRRTTMHDRFYFTKQVKWNKCDTDPISVP